MINSTLFKNSVLLVHNSVASAICFNDECDLYRSYQYTIDVHSFVQLMDLLLNKVFLTTNATWVCSILLCALIAIIPLYGRLSAVGLVIWFLASVFFIVGFLFCIGWVFFPLLLLLLYGGAVSIIIVAGFFVIFEEQDRGDVKNRFAGNRPFWVTFTGGIISGLICLASLWTHLSVWKSAGLFRERTGQALLKYYLFYSPDIQCYSILLVGFDFIFVLLGLIIWVVTVLLGFIMRE